MHEKLKKIIFGMLGINVFAKDVHGKEHFTSDQREKLVAQFGEAFVGKFENGALNSDAVPSSSDAQAELIDLITSAKSPKIEALQKQLEDATLKNKTLQEVVDALSNEPEDKPAADGIRGAVLSLEKSLKVNMQAEHYAGAVVYLTQSGDLPKSIDVSDLKKEFGTYLGGAQNVELHKQVFLGFETAKFMTTKIADHEFRATSGLISSVVQQFSTTWTPSGKIKFTPLTINNRRHKINIELTPNDVVESWLLYMYDESLSPDKMPITRYITQELVMPKILEDIEMRMIAKGKYNPTAAEGKKDGDSGTAPEDGMDGFETILVNAKKSKDKGVNFYEKAFNYLTASDIEILNFVSELVGHISPFYRKKNMPLFCSPEFYRRYKLAYKNIWGAGSGTTDSNFGSDRIDFSTSVLTPLDSMYASPILFTTPKENFIKLRRQKDTTQLINDVQKVNYNVKLFGEFWIGAGFAIGEAITAFVPDNYDPYTTVTACLGANTDLKANQWLGANQGVVTPPSTPEEGA